MATDDERAIAADLRRDWRFLCAKVGERRAGTAAERAAARFIATRLSESGLSKVGIEPFPCASLRSVQVGAEAWHPGRGWRTVEAAALVGAPSTPGGRWAEGALVWLEMPEGSPRLRVGSLRDRILVLFGPMPVSVSVHRRLLAAEPLAVVHVDDRLPFGWAKNDGVYPHWVSRFGMPPMLTVPYAEAWRWRRDGVAKLRVRVKADLRPAHSQNVVAEHRGHEAHLPAIVLAAHHDTQGGNPGADDNASGVVCLLALATLTSRLRLRRTVRFISFGAEEQLSVGSSAYVRRHRPGRSDTGLVINFDSVSSPLGHWTLSVAGSDGLAHFSRRRLARSGLDVSIQNEITPFADQFPFNWAGIPSLWFMRTNFPGGRWQHHSRHDTLKNVSPAVAQRLLLAVCPLVTDLASRKKWPFPSRLAPREHAVARRIGRELFGEERSPG